MIEKFMFVIRFILVKLFYFKRLKTYGFIFLEPDICFKIAKRGIIIIEKGAYIKKGSVFECGEKGIIIIKKGVVVGNYNWIGSTYRVEIGVKSLIGSHVTILDVNHLHNPDSFIADQGFTEGETIIGDDCLIGTKATIGANVKIGRGCIIGANAVVTKDIPEYSIAVGVPAKVVRKRG